VFREGVEAGHAGGYAEGLAAAGAAEGE